MTDVQSVLDSVVVVTREDNTVPTSWEETKDLKISFGKFKGTTFQDLITDTGKLEYLRYLSEWPELKDPMKTCIKIALPHGVKSVEQDLKLTDAVQYTLPFGRYKDQKLLKLVTTGKGQEYIRWLAKRPNLTTAIPAKKVVQYLDSITDKKKRIKLV